MPAKPKAPAYVSAHSPGPTTAVVDVPNGDAFVIEAMPAGGSRKEVARGTGQRMGDRRRFKIAGLTPDTVYHFDARATTPRGDSSRTRSKPLRTLLALVFNTRPVTPPAPGVPTVPPTIPGEPPPTPTVPVEPIPTPPPPTTPEPDPPEPESPRTLIGLITPTTRLEPGTRYRLSASQTTSAKLTIPDNVDVLVDPGVVVRYANVEAFRYLRYVAPAGDASPLLTFTAHAWVEGLWGGTADPTASLTLTSLGTTVVDGIARTTFDLGTAKLVGQVRVTPRAGQAAAIRHGRIEASNTADFAKPVVLARIQASPTEGVNVFDARGSLYQSPIDFVGNGGKVAGGEWRYGNGQRAANFRSACEDSTLDITIGGHYPGEGVTLFGTLRTTLTLRATRIWGNLVYVSHNAPKSRDLVIRDCVMTEGSIQENGIRVMDADGGLITGCDIVAGLFKLNAIRVHGTADILIKDNDFTGFAQSGPMGGGDGGQLIGISQWYDAAGRLVDASLADLGVTATKRAAELAHRLTNVRWVNNRFNATIFSVDAGIEGVATVTGGTMAADPTQTGATNVLACPISRGRLTDRYPSLANTLPGDVVRAGSIYAFSGVAFTGNASLATFRAQVPAAWTFAGCTYNGAAFTGGTAVGWGV